MMQGDSYKIPISIEVDGTPLSASNASEVEVIVGGVRKSLSDGGIEYRESDSIFLFSLTQKESFRFMGAVPVDVRVLLKNGDVIGTKAGSIKVDQSQSKVVLMP